MVSPIITISVSYIGGRTLTVDVNLSKGKTVLFGTDEQCEFRIQGKALEEEDNDCYIGNVHLVLSHTNGNVWIEVNDHLTSINDVYLTQGRWDINVGDTVRMGSSVRPNWRFTFDDYQQKGIVFSNSFLQALKKQ